MVSDPRSEVEFGRGHHRGMCACSHSHLCNGNFFRRWFMTSSSTFWSVSVTRSANPAFVITSFPFWNASRISCRKKCSHLLPNLFKYKLHNYIKSIKIFSITFCHFNKLERMQILEHFGIVEIQNSQPSYFLPSQHSAQPTPSSTLILHRQWR